MPSGEVAIRIPRATKERPPFAGTPGRQFTGWTLGAFYAKWYRPSVLALGVLGTGKELSVPPGFHHHRAAAVVALFVRRFVGGLLFPKWLGVT